jgi:hypothetical protein
MKYKLLSLLAVSTLVLSGCSSDTSEPGITDGPVIIEETPIAEHGESELTPKQNNSQVEIEQRLITDLNALYSTIEKSMSQVNSIGVAQSEDILGTKTIMVFDPSREKDKRALMIYQNEPRQVFALPESMIEAYSGNGGLFRLDMLKLEAQIIENILTYDLPAQGDLVPAATAYEKLFDENGNYTFVSPLFAVEITVFLNSEGLVTKISEKQADGVYTYEFKYSVAEYAEDFKEAF